MVLAREKKPARGQKNEEEVHFHSHKKAIKLPNPPSILVLDSKGNIHAFRYYDTRCSAPILSMSIKPFSNEDFQDHQKLLKGRLVVKRRIRSKSSKSFKLQKVVPCSAQGRNRSKSEVSLRCLPTGVKILYSSFWSVLIII